MTIEKYSHFPDRILVADLDGGYIFAERDDKTTFSTIDVIKGYAPIYKYKEYYHDLDSALKDFRK